jgi:hypothetical protein
MKHGGLLGAGKWWQIDDLVAIILAFAEGKAAFCARAVSRLWRRITEDGSSSFWEGIILDVLPSVRAPTLLLKKYCPRYAQLRHFSKMSLANQLTVQHLVLFDVTFFPIAWLTNVALSTLVADIALVLFYCIPPEQKPLEPAAMVLLGNGQLLDPRKPLAEHVWPGRGGRSGCRGDLCVVVKSLQLAGEIRSKASDVLPQEFSDVLSNACRGSDLEV